MTKLRNDAQLLGAFAAIVQDDWLTDGDKLRQITDLLADHVPWCFDRNRTHTPKAAR